MARQEDAQRALEILEGVDRTHPLDNEGKLFLIDFVKGTMGGSDAPEPFKRTDDQRKAVDDAARHGFGDKGGPPHQSETKGEGRRGEQLDKPSAEGKAQ